MSPATAVTHHFLHVLHNNVKAKVGLYYKTGSGDIITNKLIKVCFLHKVTLDFIKYLTKCNKGEGVKRGLTSY